MIEKKIEMFVEAKTIFNTQKIKDEKMLTCFMS